ncbi:MAG: PD-(D/E)XK nuclease family protein [Candidatus Neomarinimicrobiota bacterium]|tara:strand:+ start:17911 stop:18657 length:747 start_codon:yes stop_codon:yes gene_type:complete
MNNIFDKDLKLVEPGHKYVLTHKPEIKFRSVTEIIGGFFEPFDKMAVAKRLVTTHPKYQMMSIEDLISIWDAKRDFGTKIHNEIETCLNDSDYPTKLDIYQYDVKTRYALAWLRQHDIKYDLEIYPEVKVFSSEINIAGSIDVLLYNKNTDSYAIIDWKTSRKIDKKAYKNKKGTHSITENLQDCKFVHYSLQLSFYRYLLEEYYGLKISNQLIAHITDTGCLGLQGNYYQDEVVDMIKHHCSSLNKA